MDRGTYVAASGGLVQFRKLEIVNNNLANINTPGFKREILTSQEQSFDQTFAKALARGDPYAEGDHKRSPSAVNLGSVTDFSAGPVRETGHGLDVALRKPNQFFVIQTPQGEQYTRAGNFTLSGEGQLVTQDGFQVLGDGGELVATGAGAKITNSGQFISGGTAVGALQVVEIADPSKLSRAGSNRFKIDERVGIAGVDPDVVAGALEMSNVSAITSMVDMMATNRAFEAYSKTSATIDQMNAMSISQLGRRT